jgi:hypothetical protein
MKSEIATRRLLELGGLLLIGEGFMGLVHPRRYSLLWRFGPPLVKAAIDELVEHPHVARGIYALELAAGVALAVSQTEQE